MKAKLKNGPVGRIRILLVGVSLATLIGCVGYVDGGGGYGGSAVVVADPDVYVFGGGGYERGHDVHDYSHRGAVSRAAAHPAPHAGGPGERR